jgi:hypothetical protein
MKATKGGARAGAGRPATGKGIHAGVRIQAHDLVAIDEWAAVHECTRPEAIRRLTKVGLLADKAQPRKNETISVEVLVAGEQYRGSVDQSAAIGQHGGTVVTNSLI